MKTKAGDLYYSLSANSPEERAEKISEAIERGYELISTYEVDDHMRKYANGIYRKYKAKMGKKVKS